MSVSVRHGHTPSASPKVFSIVVLGVAAWAMPSGPASAEGFFDFLFGGAPKQAAPARLTPQTSSYADPGDSVTPPRPVRRERRHVSEPAGERVSEGASGGAYCVRLCDGRYFPIQRSAGASTAEACKSFCPASKTKVFFSDSDIDAAATSDGKRYADLDTAYVYREKVVADCTCNGKNPTGLAPVDAKADPTLRAGDVLATADGLMVYQGGESTRRGRTAANFTPVASSNLPADLRQKLSQLKVAPPVITSAPQIASTEPAPADDRRRAQLDK
jgi:hypothetical protein